MAKKKEQKKDEKKQKAKASESGKVAVNEHGQLIERLNYALALEFAATIQYMNQQCVVKGHDRQDYAPFFATSSSEAHLHAQNLGNKIVALGGVPTIEPAEVRASNDLGEMLGHDLEMEREALNAYIAAWEVAGSDRPLRFWLENIIQEEQLHVDELAKLTADHA